MSVLIIEIKVVLSINDLNDLLYRIKIMKTVFINNNYYNL